MKLANKLFTPLAVSAVLLSPIPASSQPLHYFYSPRIINNLPTFQEFSNSDYQNNNYSKIIEEYVRSQLRKIGSSCETVTLKEAHIDKDIVIAGTINCSIILNKTLPKRIQTKMNPSITNPKDILDIILQRINSIMSHEVYHLTFYSFYDDPTSNVFEEGCAVHHSVPLTQEPFSNFFSKKYGEYEKFVREVGIDCMEYRYAKDAFSIGLPNLNSMGALYRKDYLAIFSQIIKEDFFPNATIKEITRVTKLLKKGASASDVLKGFKK